MKVLLVNAVCGAGSTGRICTDIVERLAEGGDEGRIAFAHGEARRIDPTLTYRINGRRGYYVHNAVSRLTDRAGFYSARQTLLLIDFIRGYKPDIIHLHNLHGYYINVRILFEYLAEAGIPVVWTLHDCWAFTGHCAHYSYNGCDKWLTECHHCPQLRTYPQSLLLDQSRRNYNEKKELFTAVREMTITTPSEWLAGEVRKSFLGKFKVQPIYNGIDLDVFRPTEGDIRRRYGIADDKRLLLSVANEWSERKGLRDLTALHGMLDPARYVQVVVGLDRKTIATLPPGMIGLERTDSIEELAEWYSAADVFVNPSYEETMGMVTAEALACGTPAVVYDQTAVPEVVDSRSGIVVRAGDVQGLAEAIPAALKLTAQDGRRRAQTFEKKQQYSKYLSLYNSLLSNAR